MWLRAEPDPADPARATAEWAGGRIALFAVEGRWYALDDVCAHRAGPLSEGTLERTRKGVLVTCPFHGWQFELLTGRCATVRGKSVRAYPVRADETGLHVLVPDEPDTV